jgi:hypothetical protein
VNGEGASAAVVRGAGLVWLSVLSLSFIAFALTLSSSYFLLLDSTVPLLFEVALTLAVAVKAAASMGRLGVHLVGLLEHELRLVSCGSPGPKEKRAQVGYSFNQ